MSTTGRANPFRVGTEIRDPVDFIGRRATLDAISRAMLDLQNVSLHSERRTGKTSLLLYLANPKTTSVTKIPPEHIPVYFNCQRFAKASEISIWRAIADAVAEQFEKRFPDELNTYTRFRTTVAKLPEIPGLFATGLGKAFADLGIAGFKIHLLFDEFDQTINNPNLGDPFYHTLRSLPMQSGNLSYLIATRTGLAALQPNYDQPSSPLFNIFTTEILPLFSKDEVTQLILKYFARAGIDFSLAEKLRAQLYLLYEITGYHPFFLQTFCYHLFERLNEPQWPLGQAKDEALKAFERDADPHFEYYWRVSSKDERNLIKKLAFRESVGREQLEHITRSLQDRCLIVKIESAWRLFSSAFAKWVLQSVPSSTPFIYGRPVQSDEALNALESARIQNRPEPQLLIDRAILSIEVGQEVEARTRQQLTSLAASNPSSILHAIRRIIKTNPQDVVRRITEWLQAEDGSNLRVLGQRAGHQLFEENAYPDIQLFDERHSPLLDLVGPLLSTDANIVNTMLATLLVWLKQKGGTDRVYKTLLYVVNRATPEERAILRAGLSELWLDDDTEDARRIGQSLIARSYIMDGGPVDMPGNYYGVIAIDASYEANFSKRGATAGRKLYARLNSQIDVQIVRMGATGFLAQPGEFVSTSDLQAGHDHPRLLVRQLEDLNPDKVYFVLALAWEQIVDLDDLFDGVWIERLIVATVKQQKAAYPNQLYTIAVDPLLSEERSLSVVETAVQKRLAQTLARRKPDEWEVNLRDYLECDYHNVGAVIERLDNWITQLDDIECATHPKDVARLIVCTVLWLASQDLAHCVSIVRKWLTSETQVEHSDVIQVEHPPNSPIDKDNVEDDGVDGERGSNELYCLIGQACGKALFNLYAHATPVPPVETHAVLLELVPELAKQSWSGAETILHTVRRWAVQPEWAERLLTRPDGSFSELIELVDAVLPENQESRTRILKGWTKPLDAEDKESVPELIKKLTEQLQLRVALGTRAPLPALPEGHTYGLVIVDASDRNPRTRHQLAKLSSKVIKRLTKVQKTFHLLTYRMGQDFPVAGPGETPDADALIPVGLGQRPRLLSPLLEMHSVEQVGFILLLANSPALDEEDWRDTHWNERVVVYSEASQPLWAESFTLIPKQSGLEDAQRVIVNYLTKNRSVR